MEEVKLLIEAHEKLKTTDRGMEGVKKF